jgi:alkylhydroperoxidase family enzyme
MADNVSITAGSGTAIAADDIGPGVWYQRVKATWGPDGTANDADNAAGKALPVRGEGRFFSAAATTLTRPANVTAYAANDSISNNATAGSVTALSATLVDVNDAPMCISAVLVDTTDTGLANGIQVRAYLYNSDPTASSGVVGGDNAAFSNKRGGFIGAFSGTMRPFSDGGKCRMVPEEGNFIVVKPTSGAATIFIQYQTLAAFTPSANSTTLIGTLEGFQGRA